MAWLRLQPLAGLVALLVLLAAPAARAQVVDDSTKVLYGPKTTRVIYEAEVLRDSTSGTPLDTTLTRWPQARFWFHDTTFQQDLGAVGTASRPLLYQPNLQLGARFGRNVFDKYARDATKVPYYDSRSPYSFFRVVQSGAGEQEFEISYSRSLKKNFSVGIAYERIASNKILASRSTRDGLVEHSNLLLFGRYQSEDERYHLLFNLSNVRHRAIEQGGIWPITSTVRSTTGQDSLIGQTRPQDLFNFERERVYLTQAANKEDRDEVYFTQTYRLLGRGLTAYHTFDAKRQYNSYSDLALTRLDNGSLLFYPGQPLRNTHATIDRAEYRQVENTVGVLGRTKAVEYRLYARNRIASLRTQRLDSSAAATVLPLMQAAPTRNFNELFLGGTAAFNYRTIYAIETAGELHALSLGSPYSNYPEYWLRASIRTGPLSAEALRSSYSPTLTQQEFVGNHYEWHHLPGSSSEFLNTNTTQLTGRLHLKLPNLGSVTQHRFEASASAVNIDNLVYYNTAGVPAQIETARNLFIASARHQVRVGRVGFDNQGTYTKGGDVEGIRIPELVTHSRVFYESYIFRKAMFSQVGAEVYFQSSYRAFNYSPSTQQFYQQDNFTIDRYPPVVDVFFTADIKTVTVFLKAAYVNQGIFDNGYFTTPYYTGYPRRFQLGVKWDFFN
ncbi:putative porin [Hymenobacter sp. BT770]|uniref:putative porin n=1 Tax=Hymenobacter sp. BT770 TaxID=2886942 RepID=UPI001D10DBA6|nr:putative porin [Hymenobacter sp. BT770]MDO3416593.1 putative porin [Hymenobacter sp. BT770]